jgi:hypothetical protein
MFAAVAAITVAVIAAFLVFGDEGVRCVEGEMQDNATRPDGSVLPRVERFSTFAEAEAFICRSIPHPRQTEGLTLREVRVARERSLGDTIEGEGGAELEADYLSMDGQVTHIVTFGAAFPPRPLLTESGQPLSINGRDGVLIPGEPGGEPTEVVWNQDGWTLRSSATLDPDFRLQALLDVLESVR